MTDHAEGTIKETTGSSEGIVFVDLEFRRPDRPDANPSAFRQVGRRPSWTSLRLVDAPIITRANGS